MLILTAYVPTPVVERVCRSLAELDGVRHVTSGSVTENGKCVVSGRVASAAIESVVAALRECRLDSADVYLSRSAFLQPLVRSGSDEEDDPDEPVEVELLQHAEAVTRLRAAFLLNMVAAGVIAGVGVLTGSSILVVGAMAISPDLLPIVAIVIGVLGRQWSLVVRATTVLFVGLTVGCAAAFSAVSVMRAVDRVDDLSLADSVLGPSLTSLGPGSLLVALAAGMAGVLAIERVGGAVTGVAISATTIPAAAYIGDSLAIDGPHTSGALWVLLVNIVLMIAAGTMTMYGQRWRRSRALRVPVTPAGEPGAA